MHVHYVMLACSMYMDNPVYSLKDHLFSVILSFAG